MPYRLLTWVMSAAFCTGVFLGCNDAKKSDGAPAPRYSSAPLSVGELCLLRVNSTTPNFCTAAALPLAQNDQSSGYVCRKGEDAYDWAAALLASQTQNRVRIDWAKARECLETSRQLRHNQPAYALLRSEAWQSLEATTCQNLVTGLILDGEMCESDWDCQNPESACNSGDETTPDSKRCQPKAQEGAPCSVNFIQCADGLFCNGDGRCQTLGAGSDPCDVANLGTDCLSQSCSNGLCDPEPSRALGETCSANTQCLAPCTSCRPAAAGADPTCRWLSGPGEPCVSVLDCLEDLGCTDGVCKTVGEGSHCGESTQSLCAAGLGCLSEVPCFFFDFDQPGCAQTAGCVYDDETSWCQAAVSTCVSLPSTGPCLYGYGCAYPTHYCDSALVECRGYGLLDDSCDENEGGARPLCGEGLACAMTDDQVTRCTLPCISDAECSSGFYCDMLAPVAVCAPLPAEGVCSQAGSCGQSMYCDLPDTSHCNAAPLDACEQGGLCMVQGEVCVGRADLSGTCRPKLGAGAPCINGAACESGVCQNDAQDVARCTVTPRGCNRTGLAVHLTFLLGMVWGLGRKRRLV